MPDPRDDLEDARPDAPAGLFFSRRGNWFHDGQRVFHRRLADLLCRSVVRDDAGHLIVTTGRDAVPFVSEDAPLIVRSVSVEGDGLQLSLSDGTTAPLEGSVRVGDDGRMRVALAARRLWALLSRSAQQGLEPHLVAEDRLACGARSWGVVVAPGPRRWDDVP
jgi:hypothetical protein